MTQKSHMYKLIPSKGTANVPPLKASTQWFQNTKLSMLNKYKEFLYDMCSFQGNLFILTSKWCICLIKTLFQSKIPSCYGSVQLILETIQQITNLASAYTKDTSFKQNMRKVLHPAFVDLWWDDKLKHDDG